MRKLKLKLYRKAFPVLSPGNDLWFMSWINYYNLQYRSKTKGILYV